MIKNHPVLQALENIYISPLELCNLNCRLCYTNKTKNILSNEQILQVISKYNEYLQNKIFADDIFASLQRVSINQPKKISSRKLSLKSILFCGGEVFTLSEFPSLVNRLIDQNLFITIITNGTIDRLDEIKDPSSCQLLVSLDGPREIHDQNRGTGNFDKSISFIRKALKLGFPVEIMFLITPDSYPYKDSFLPYLNLNFKLSTLKLNYITQKTHFYTNNHPLSNQNNTQNALTPEQIIDIKKNYNSIPGKNFGCFQLTLQSNGQIYGCCESPTPIGKMEDEPQKIIKNFLNSLLTCRSCHISSLNLQSTIDNLQSGICHGCTNPEFLCGYKSELQLINCQSVVQSFNEKV